MLRDRCRLRSLRAVKNGKMALLLSFRFLISVSCVFFTLVGFPSFLAPFPVAGFHVSRHAPFQYARVPFSTLFSSR